MHENQIENLDQEKKDTGLFWVGLFLVFLFIAIGFFLLLLIFFKGHV